MNLFVRTLGFQNFNSDFEEKFIKTGIKESLKDGFVIRHASLNRGVIILRLSKSTGLYIYGRFKGKTFKYEYYYPFVVGKRVNDNDELLVERHLDKESFAVICDELKTGVTLIFFLQNVMDYLEYLCSGKDFTIPEFDLDQINSIYKTTIKKKKISLSALSLGGMILFPVKKNTSYRTKEAENNRKNLIEAARKGDEEAIETLTIEDIDIYNQLSQRVMNEDLFTIVDSTFMPCGVECDQYSVIGEILELDVEENIYTGETIYIMVLECNGLVITTAINKAFLLGEPEVGRRFKGQIWLQGNVKFME